VFCGGERVSERGLRLRESVARGRTACFGPAGGIGVGTGGGYGDGRVGLAEGVKRASSRSNWNLKGTIPPFCFVI